MAGGGLLHTPLSRHSRAGTLRPPSLALAMVVLGPWAAIVSEQVHFGTKLVDPPFLGVEFIEMIVFALQVGLAIWLRRDAAAHKGLMLLSTLFLTTFGFGRWLADPLQALVDPAWKAVSLSIIGH